MYRTSTILQALDVGTITAISLCFIRLFCSMIMDLRHIQEELYQQVFIHAESVFPEFHFRRTGKGFIATQGNGLDGSQNKASGKISYLEKSPAVLFDNRSGITRNVLKYIQERENLVSYMDALRFCAKEVGYNIDSLFSRNITKPQAIPYKHQGIQGSEESIDTGFGEDTGFSELEREQKKRQAFEEVQLLFSRFLWEQKGNTSREYLSRRGYTDEDIHTMNAGSALPFSHVQQHLRGLGYSDELIRELGLQTALPDKIEANLWHKIGETYTVSFPLRDSVGQIQGFIIRAKEVLYDNDGKERFPKYLFTKNFSKAVPIGFHNGLVGKECIIVEGIIDALFLQARGILNVVAIGGKILSDEQVQTLERYRVQALTFCLDSDAAGQEGTAFSIQKIRKKLFQQSSSKPLSNHILSNLYVCKTSAMKGLKDPDEFVREHGEEAFVRLLHEDIISAEQSMAEWVVQKVLKDAPNIQANEIHTSPRLRNAVSLDAWQYQRTLISPLQQADFAESLHAITGLEREAISLLGEQASRFAKEERERREFSLAIQAVHNALQRGEDVSALQRQLHDHLQKKNDQNRSEHAPSTYTMETFLQEICEMPKGLQTGYSELDENVSLSQNGITIIAARPSHGKTSFKMNLLLNVIEQYPDRTFYFFSYEEPVKIIILKLLNILAGIRFQGQQLADLAQYFRQQYRPYQPNLNGFGNGKALIDGIEAAKKKLDEYLSTGRLVLSGERYSPQEIRRVLDARESKNQLGGVFVDYVQKIKSETKFSTRQLELQDISSQLHRIAVELHAPMIVGAQFNREVRSESDIRDDCLREAGDLEQDANLVLALWNPAKGENDDKQSSLVQASSNLDARRVELKVKTLKNRDGAVNAKGVSLLYDMPLSTIRSMKNQ